MPTAQMRPLADEMQSSANLLATSQNVTQLIVGVVTFNNAQAQLDQLMRSIEIAAGSLGEFSVALRVYVIDNGQKSTWKDSPIQIKRLDPVGNVGFGKAMNTLMSAAFSDERTEWFLCLNPDGVLHHKALKELLSSSFIDPTSLIEARQFPEEHLKEYDPKTLETSWVSAACLLIPRTVYETIGGFDPEFFMYLEDVDYSWRARSAGFSLKIAPNALLGHPVLDRDPNRETVKFYFLSGRYLALKWNAPKFVNWAENNLLKQGFFSSKSELPTLNLKSRPKYINRDVADFNHKFYFSPQRWRPK